MMATTENCLRAAIRLGFARCPAVSVVPILCVLLLGSAGRTAFAATWRDDFSTEPAGNGWIVLGDDSLFEWDASSACVRATWDSSRQNSFFYRPLGTILTKTDDFAFAFDLEMDGIEIGVDPAKPYTFQLAVGLIQRRDATDTNFFRAAGINATYGPRNLVEFNYFPDSGFGETFAPTVVSTNNRIAFSSNHPLPLTVGDRFRIRMEYTAQDVTLRTTVTRNGAPYGLPPDQSIRDLFLGEFPDFRVDGVAVCSYNDGQQFPEMFAGSLLAHGRFDNVEVTTPESPLLAMAGGFEGGVWRVSFLGRTNWQYHLERSQDLGEWEVVSTRAGAEGALSLQDEAPPTEGAAFYRVRAER